MLRALIPLTLLLLGLGGCAKRLEPDLEPLATVPVHTEDGWELELRHHGGEGPPVLLMHGMAANHYNWDYRADASPVDELVAAGFDVWVGSLRGDPRTVPPERKAARRIDFDQHALYDAPALVDAVLEQTEAPELLWVGHSMGGMLLYTTLASRPDGIRAGIAIASPATFTKGLHNHAAMRSLGWMVAARRGRMPVRTLVKLHLVSAGMVRAQLGNKHQLDRGLLRGMSRHVLIDLPRPLARQARGWIRGGGLTHPDGTPWLDGASSTVPLLVLGAPADRIAHEPDVAHACEIFSDCRYLRLGLEEGFSADYGHVDPVIGTTAHDEVYPLILDFLEAHRPADEVAQEAAGDAILDGVEEGR